MNFADVTLLSMRCYTNNSNLFSLLYPVTPVISALKFVSLKCIWVVSYKLFDMDWHLCFRNDSIVSNQINLPQDRPFVLLRYGPVCQQVYGMSCTDVFVHWDDDNDLNTSFGSGMHPADDGGNTDHTLNFCYYTTDGSISG